MSRAERDTIADRKILKISTGFQLVFAFTLEAEITNSWLRRWKGGGMLLRRNLVRSDSKTNVWFRR